MKKLIYILLSIISLSASAQTGVWRAFNASGKQFYVVSVGDTIWRTVGSVAGTYRYDLSAQKVKTLISDALPTFNVKKFGAKGDGVTDDRNAIQSAINAAISTNGGNVFFPNGKYIINGALVTSGTGVGNPNSQLYIPYSTSLSTTGFRSISFIGETPPSQITGVLGSYPVNKGGVIIYSTISGSGTFPSLLATAGSVSDDGFNLVDVTIKNIEFRVKSNISSGGVNMSAINMSNATNLTLDAVFCSIDTSLNHSVYPTANTFGVYFPRAGGGQSRATNSAMAGFKYGWVGAEHVMGDKMTSIACEYAIVFNTAFHPNYINRFNSAWCKYSVGAGISAFPNSIGIQTTTDIAQLDVEFQVGYGDWWDMSKIIYDPSNLLVGETSYQLVERNFAINNSAFSKQGGAKFHAKITGDSTSKNSLRLGGNLADWSAAAGVINSFVVYENSVMKYSAVNDVRNLLIPSGNTTGNSATTTKLFTARNIGISGVTSTPQPFDGSANINIPISSIPGALISGNISGSATGTNLNQVLAAGSTATGNIDVTGSISSGGVLTTGNATDNRRIVIGMLSGSPYIGAFNNGATASADLALNPGGGRVTVNTAPANPTDVVRLQDLPTTASGTYTPTVTSISGASSITAYPCQWSRIGSIVTLAGKVRFTMSTANSSGSVSITLPSGQSSNFTLITDANGSAITQINGFSGASIYAVPSSSNLQLYAASTSSTVAQEYSFTCQYIIKP